MASINGRKKIRAHGRRQFQKEKGLSQRKPFPVLLLLYLLERIPQRKLQLTRRRAGADDLAKFQVRSTVRIHQSRVRSAAAAIHRARGIQISVIEQVEKFCPELQLVAFGN